jgi:hypothetical protein
MTLNAKGYAGVLQALLYVVRFTWAISITD